jgi:hypothetical protein
MSRTCRSAIHLWAAVALAPALSSCVVPIPVASRAAPESVPPPGVDWANGARSALSDSQRREVLAAQNAYRRELGEADLVWSDVLAGSAQAWAEHLAHDVHALEHSGVAGRGENLAMQTSGWTSLARLVALWGDEKRYFVNASFPDVSSTGSWKTVGHYTQMIWRGTTQVGCGLASGGGHDFLVCHYAPQGNFMGERVL